MSEHDHTDSTGEGGDRRGPPHESPRDDPRAPGQGEPVDQPGAGHGPPDPMSELSDSDVADRFADIVARWESGPGATDASAMPPASPPSRTADTSGSGSDAEPSTDSGEHGRGSASPRGAQEAGGAAEADPPPREPHAAINPPPGSGWRVHRPPPEPEEDFVPPAPRPLPQDPGFWAALIGLVCGPLWLLYLSVIHPSGSRLQIALSIALTVGGFAILVARLPRRGQRDDDDDGAIV